MMREMTMNEMVKIDGGGEIRDAVLEMCAGAAIVSTAIFGYLGISGDRTAKTLALALGVSAGGIMMVDGAWRLTDAALDALIDLM
jgi:hypothetical protein